MNEPVNMGDNRTASPNAGGSDGSDASQNINAGAGSARPGQPQPGQSAGAASQFSGSDADADAIRQSGGGQSGANGGGRANLGGSVNRFVGQLRDKAMSAADQQKHGVASRLEDVAQAVHRSGEQLRGQQDWAAEAIQRGADELQSIAGRLRNADARELLNQLRGFADRQPAMFAAASLVAGLALGRLVKLAAAGGSGGNLPRAPEMRYVAS